MARLAAARWNPVSFQGQLSWMAAPPKTVFVHTNGGGANIAGPNGYFSNTFNAPGDNYHVGIGSTLQVYWDGQADQMCDSQQIIWAEFQASRFAASIESQDDGNPATPWTEAQMATIVKLIQEMGITPKLMTDPYSAGVGYHQMWTPTWNDNYHNCPGATRVAQLRGEVMQELAGGQSGSGYVVIKELHILAPGAAEPRTMATAARALVNSWTGANSPLLPYNDVKGVPLGYPKADTQFAFALGHFQSMHGLKPDMIVGPVTWTALLNSPWGLPDLAASNQVSAQYTLILRSLLGAHGYFLLPRTGGSWDTSVVNCLTDFQRKSKLTPDGVVGEHTWAALLWAPQPA